MVTNMSSVDLEMDDASQRSLLMKLFIEVQAVYRPCTDQGQLGVSAARPPRSGNRVLPAPGTPRTLTQG